MMRLLRITGWRAVAFILAGVAIVLVGIALTMCVVELPVEEYSTLGEARAEGALARGWLPSFLPASARSIREVHSLDNEARWLSFSAAPAELRAFAATLNILPYRDAVANAGDRPWRVRGDWPPELSAGNLATPRSTSLLGYFRSSTDDYCFAIEWSTGRVWGWSCPLAG
jgi:hypothetical protein